MSTHSASTIAGLSANGLRVAIVFSRWNGEVTQRLLNGAIDAFAKMGAEDIKVVSVPGAFELPAGARARVDGRRV